MMFGECALRAVCASFILRCHRQPAALSLLSGAPHPAARQYAGSSSSKCLFVPYVLFDAR